MSAEAAFATRSWKVGRYTCTLTVPRIRFGEVMHATCDWSPEQPQRLSAKEAAEYRRSFAKAMVEISREFGINGRGAGAVMSKLSQGP
jgi:hypothetical protein